MESLIRNREEEGTLVTFHAPDMTFSRVYKGMVLRPATRPGSTSCEISTLNCHGFLQDSHRTR
ncbi:hypothetical protein C8Q80DRAFT_1197618 [Daedaleopsis nitida]|nr:hypothetical protein C8Q80DRAFT_1197618 [Daedaleopsis nitida]